MVLIVLYFMKVWLPVPEEVCDGRTHAGQQVQQGTSNPGINTGPVGLLHTDPLSGYVREATYGQHDFLNEA